MPRRRCVRRISKLFQAHLRSSTFTNAGHIPPTYVVCDRVTRDHRTGKRQNFARPVGSPPASRPRTTTYRIIARQQSNVDISDRQFPDSLAREKRLDRI
ncbi:unnamed protein product [Lasius platythorax]|uniref:Uncharacterized protein n=1 Tax=Lasius platythorax TaxID=488582 RepID=A0AAV2N7H8_9HYME